MTLEWLKSLNHLPAKGARFTFIFVSESLNDRLSSKLYKGYAEPPFALVRYSGDHATMIDVILHEIGHLCGTVHDMGATKGRYYTNREVDVVKKNCG